jgi:hypothetical protein
MKTALDAPIPTAHRYMPERKTSFWPRVAGAHGDGLRDGSVAEVVTMANPC